MPPGMSRARTPSAGLVGSSANRIITTYATGNVSGTGSRGSGASECELGGGGVGGLVGNACDLGIASRIAGGISASYARGTVSGEAAVGGLVGTVHPEFIFRRSYWDLETSGVRAGLGQDDRNDNGVIDGTESHSLGLAGQTTAALQAPTDFEGIYENWNLDLDLDEEPDAYWYFGTSSQYPVLAVDLDQTGSATWQEFGYQVRAGLTLTATTTEGEAQVVLNWTAVSTSPWSPAPNLAYTLVRDDGTTIEAVAEGITARQYTDTDLTIGNTYTYRVAALLDGGAAVRSWPVSVIVGVANQPPVTVGIMEDLTLRVDGGTQGDGRLRGVPGSGERHTHLWGVLFRHDCSHRQHVGGPVDNRAGGRRPVGCHRDGDRHGRVQHCSDSAVHSNRLAGGRGGLRQRRRRAHRDRDAGAARCRPPRLGRGRNAHSRRDDLL